MKFTFNPFLVASLGIFAALSHVASAGDVTKADNINNLNLGTSWGGTAPSATDVALWTGAYDTAGSLSSTFTASTPVSWQGIRIGNITGTAAGLISIGGTGSAVTGSQITIGTSGIDMSAANQNLVINAATTVISGNQIWNVATGRNLRFGTTGTGGANANLDGSGTVTIQGGGVVDLNQGGGSGFSDAAGLAGFSGKWIVDSGATLRGIRNGATAFGSNTAADAITLNGGTLATGGIAGATGNWTWNSNITLATSTSSTIDNQNPSGTGRSLKLMGAFTGSGNMTFASTGAGTMSADNGFVVTATNTNSGTVTINSGAFLRVGGVNTASDTTLAAGTGGTLGNGSITNNVVNNGTLTFSRSDTHTVANAISGSGVVRIGGAVSGAGTQVLTLSGTNTYTGTTTVGQGRLNLTGSLTSAVTVASGATLTGTGSTTGLLTLSAGSSVLLSGSGAVTANGVTAAASVNLVDPTLNTVGAHSFTVVTYGAGAAPTLANFTINGGGPATIRGAGLVNTGTATTLNYTTVANTWNTTSGTWDLATSANWANGSDSLYYNGDSASFNEPTSASTVTLTGVLSPASVTVSNTTNAYIFSGAGAITGPGGLTKNNAGTLAIASQQSYTGGTIINGGVLDLTGGAAAGGGTIRGTVTVNSGGTLRLSVGDATGYSTDATRLGIINLVGGTLQVNTIANQTLGSAVINMTGASITGITGSNIDLFANGTAINTLASATTSAISLPTMNLRQNDTAFGIADGAAAVDLLISSNLGNGSTGNHNLIKNGAGAMTLSGLNTYNGTTTVSGGTLTVSGTTNATSAVTVNGGASLIVSTGGTLTTSGALSTANSTGANITVQSGATLNAASANIAWNPSTFLVDGTLAVTGNLAVATNAIGTISGTNGSITAGSFSMGNATTTVNFTNTGSMAFTGDMTLAATNSTFNQSAGTISANGLLLNSGTSSTYALTGGRINLGSGGIGGTGAAKTVNLGAGTVGARADWSSALAMSLTNAATGTTFNTLDSVDSATARTITLSGVLSGTGQLVKSGIGTLALSGANTYSGGTTLGGGILALGSAGALGSSGNVIFAGGTLQYSANNTTDYSARIASGTSTSSVSIDTNGQDVAFGTGLTASQSGGLTKIGAGTLTLGVANLYTGPTNVNGGRLVVNGSFASTTTTVASGATLAGIGSLAGTTTIQSGGIHGPGNSPGVQSFSNLTYNDGSIFSWEIDRTQDQTPTGRGTGYDAVNVSGTLAGQDGTDDSAIFRVVIGDANFANDFWTSSHTWSDIFTSDGSNSITNWTSIFGGGIKTYNGGVEITNTATYGSFSFTPGTNSLTWSAVPEPTSALAGILLGAGLLRRNRATRFFRG